MLRKIRQILYRSIESREIQYQKMLDIIKKHSDSILLDVRSLQEYNEGHLQGAINIPVYDLEKEVSKKLPNKDTVIIIYCSSGHRSKRAKDLLEKLGYSNIYNLKNGLDGI